MEKKKTTSVTTKIKPSIKIFLAPSNIQPDTLFNVIRLVNSVKFFVLRNKNVLLIIYSERERAFGFNIPVTKINLHIELHFLISETAFLQLKYVSCLCACLPGFEFIVCG